MCKCLVQHVQHIHNCAIQLLEQQHAGKWHLSVGHVMLEQQCLTQSWVGANVGVWLCHLFCFVP
jgi:hypothetical protein